jgi:hypothetical protein
MMLAQKLHPLKALSPAWRGRTGKLWLAVNEQPDSATYSDDTGAVLAVGAVPGLAGYVTVTTPSYGMVPVEPSESDIVGSMFLQIPGFGSRDLEDAVVTKRGTEEWIQWGSTLYRPMDAVPALGAGASTVAFAAEGYAEWRVLPSAANVQIDAGTAWRLYDADMAVLDAGTTLPATTVAPAPGCYLLLFGPAGASTTVTVEPLVTGRSESGHGAKATPWPTHTPRLR